MTRLLICAAIAVLAGLGLSEVMKDLMPAAPDVVRGVFCGLAVASAFAFLWFSELIKIIHGD